MRTLNLGILAHVDAGKTSLTERLLYAAGVIDEIGSVDDGNTQTDSLALERQRGITIKSAVVSFVVDDVTVNLIDTPGHPDFIAEVERVLSVLDGAVLVISAVEGVQAQTRVLMRTLQRLGHSDAHLREQDRPPWCAIRAGVAGALPRSWRGNRRDGIGFASWARARRRIATHGAADPDFRSTLIGRSRRSRRRTSGRVRRRRADARTAGCAANSSRRPGRRSCTRCSSARRSPVPALTSLIAGITQLLPATEGDVDDPVSGTVFKVERGPAGEKIAYVRMFSGTLRVRDRVQLRPTASQGKVTAISVFDRARSLAACVGSRRADRRRSGAWATCGSATRSAQSRCAGRAALFRPTNAGDGGAAVPARGPKGALHVALAQLAEQDPLINLRQDDIAAGDLRLAVRRGAEGGHPGDAGRRLRRRRHVPRDHDDLHRTAGRHRRGGRDDRTGAESVPGHRRPAHRTGAGRHRCASSGSASNSGRCRSRSSRRSRRPCRRRCGRASTAGR